jgi:hypothetical protein
VPLPNDVHHQMFQLAERLWKWFYAGHMRYMR